MKITICDDNSEDLKVIENLLEKYIKKTKSFNFQVSKYSDSLSLFEKIKNQELSDIYILDIIMSNATGIDLGREIRKRSSQNTIIYITSSDDFALEAFNVHAGRYLLKPLLESHFFEAMDYSVSFTKSVRDPVYLVKTKDGLQSVRYSKIEYIENSSRLLYIHKTDGEIITSIFIRQSFENELEQLLDYNCFLQVHKSFLINLNHVEKLSGSNIIMKNGAVIPVSRKNTVKVKRQFLLFLAEK